MTKFAEIQNREKGLKQNLEAKQLSMIALGGAIGTGLFLGSKSRSDSQGQALSSATQSLAYSR